MFVLGDYVTYDGISGVVDFIGSTYITIRFPSYAKDGGYRTDVRMLVHSSEYKKVVASRQSER